MDKAFRRNTALPYTGYREAVCLSESLVSDYQTARFYNQEDLNLSNFQCSSNVKFIHTYIHIHTRIHTYIHTYTFTHVRVHTCVILHYITYIHTHIHIGIHKYIQIFFLGAAVLSGTWLLIIEASRLHSVTHIRYDSSGWRISPAQRPLHSQEADIHTPCGIRTHNPSKWAAVGPRLRPRGH